MSKRRIPEASGRKVKASSLAENIVRGGRPAKHKKARTGLM